MMTMLTFVLSLAAIRMGAASGNHNVFASVGDGRDDHEDANRNLAHTNNSTVINSTIINSTIINSEIINSTIIDSNIKNSIIINGIRTKNNETDDDDDDWTEYKKILTQNAFEVKLGYEQDEGTNTSVAECTGDELYYAISELESNLAKVASELTSADIEIVGGHLKPSPGYTNPLIKEKNLTVAPTMISTLPSTDPSMPPSTYFEPSVSPMPSMEEITLTSAPTMTSTLPSTNPAMSPSISPHASLIPKEAKLTPTPTMTSTSRSTNRAMSPSISAAPSTLLVPSHEPTYQFLEDDAPSLASPTSPTSSSSSTSSTSSSSSSSSSSSTSSSSSSSSTSSTSTGDDEEEDDNSTLRHRRLSNVVVPKKPLKEEISRRRLSSYTFVWGGTGSFTCRGCFGDDWDIRRRLEGRDHYLRPHHRAVQEKDNQVSDSSSNTTDNKTDQFENLENKVASEVEELLQSAYREYLEENGLESGCLGTGAIKIYYKLEYNEDSDQ